MAKLDLSSKKTKLARQEKQASRKPKPPSPQEIAAVKWYLGVRQAEQSFHSFVKQAWHVVEPDKQFSDNWHIQALCEHLEAIYDGRIANLIINIPPGTMKSLLVCVFWPAWVWSKNAGKRFMASSYSDSLSLRDSVRCRDLVISEWYQRRWPLALKEDQNTKGKFENHQGGWRMVGSVGGRGTGEHPDFLLVDDPHNVTQMESEAERQGVIDWLDSVVATRGVTRGVRRVMVMQRLHTKDASSHLLDKGTWEHICLPMRHEPGRMKPTSIGWKDPRTTDGELLWPELYTEQVVAKMEIDMGQYHAAGQLQQRPAPRGGGMFKREWFEILTACPPLMQVVRYWDKAGTKGGLGARTAGVLIGSFTDVSAAIPAMRVKYIFLDVQAHRVEAAEREAIIKQTAEMDRKMYGFVTTWIEQEPGSGGKESAQGTVGNLAGYSCMIERVTGSKEVRADPLSSQSSVGKVKLLTGTWNGMFLEELELFPVGKLKDCVDAGGGAFNKLNMGSGFSSAASLRTGGSETAELFEPDRIDFGNQ